MLKRITLSAMLTMTATLSAETYELDSNLVSSAELKAWKSARISAIAPSSDLHSIHSYFNVCPESPDGRFVLYFSSPTADAHTGELRIFDLKAGAEKILVSNLTTEDAHRVACQQWLAGGKKIAYHDYRNGRWIVAAVDPQTGKEKVLASDYQAGMGSATCDWLPIYGAHWKQGEHRDLDMVNVITGEVKTFVRVTDVLSRYGKEIIELMGEGDTSVFFPVLSPDGTKVFFKIARGNGSDNFRSANASQRHGKFIYDLVKRDFIAFQREWGHPSWSPDSNGIFEKGNILFNLRTGKLMRYAKGSPSDHPSLSPNGKLFVSDANISRRSGNLGEWGIVVGSLETHEFTTIHRFVHTNGARSWRVPHPHPIFNSAGNRIYFNISENGRTRLHVAQLHPSE